MKKSQVRASTINYTGNKLYKTMRYFPQYLRTEYALVKLQKIMVYTRSLLYSCFLRSSADLNKGSVYDSVQLFIFETNIWSKSFNWY